MNRPSSSDSSPLGPLGDRASSSSNTLQNYPYDVFISFRGLDTRNTFVDHLYAHLTRKGILAFKDDTRLHKGESISPQLLQAIQDSRVSIIVFSPNYASSAWCLDEMAAIADFKQRSNQTVFPVFYDVDPSHVRHQDGAYKNAFDLHKRKFDSDKVGQWKSSMTDFANSVGWDVRDKPESQEIEKIVQEVIKVLRHKFSRLAVDHDLVGIQPRVQELESILKLSSENDDVRVLGIWGMSGIGKTTHAKVLYVRIADKFSASCFIQDVAKIYKNNKDGGIIAIQKQIIRQTLDEKDLEKCDPFEISGIIKGRLHKIKVLIVLDDVEQIEQLEELGIDPKMLFAGSRIIVTTTDKYILESYKADVIHEVSLLNDNDARELFCRIVFKSENGSSSCVELIPKVLEYAQCLPLAIKVIGSSLYGKNADHWSNVLVEFGKCPNDKIMNALQVSIDGLERFEQKEIFLHIACFFNGERKDYVERILKCCALCPDTIIPELVNKSLITIRDDEIHMHDLLQELGKKIVRNQFRDEPGSWSRIWLCEDFVNFLTMRQEKYMVKAIVLNQKEEIPKCSIDELSKLKNLKLLILYHQSFSGSLDFLSHNLRYLSWDHYPFASLPSCFAAPYLVELNMPYSTIQRVWEGRKNFSCLKRMDLSNSKYLIETPDFSGTPKLERLDLSGCTNLSFVHPSIGLLVKLAFLSLRNCSNLVNINSYIESNLSSLRVLHLSGCTKLETTPDVTSATNLEYLDIDGCTSLSRVHESIGALAKLTFLSLRNCKNLDSIPDSINDMMSLQTLDLWCCSKLTALPLRNSSHLEALIVLDMNFCNLVEIPYAIGELKCLERLNLQGNNFVSLPPSICALHCLSYLNLSHCHELRDFPHDNIHLRLDPPSRDEGGRYFKTVSGSRDHRSGFYAFDCPNLLKCRNHKFSYMDFNGNLKNEPWNLVLPFELGWLLTLIQKPNNFRCGFDIVVPCDINVLLLWFNKGFDGGSVIRINDFNMDDDNWIGFCFCVDFELCNDRVLSSRSPRSSSHLLYLSFESKDTEEYFDMPLNLEKDNFDGSKYGWMIYITREHCHFVKTGADITFKANHPGIRIIHWGMDSIFKQDLDHNEILMKHGKLLPIPQRYTVHEVGSGPKLQVPYNWLVTVEDEAENFAAKTKEQNLSNVGL